MHEHEWIAEVHTAGGGLALLWRCWCGAVSYEASAADRDGRGAGDTWYESRQPGVD